ncbi:hypothetical protein Btru_038643 [Bulinus truncatus]|nr:hypothetical protein Btru_038643 [Bulinus truncatus]
MSDDASNKREVCCHHHPGCRVWCQDLLPSLSLPQGLVCRAGDRIRQNPYVLTYERHYRRSPFASNELNLPTTNISTNIVTCQQGPPKVNQLSSPCSVLLRTDLFNIKYRHYEGSKVVFRKPKQHCARMKFKCENRIDQNKQQQPTPSDISSRYRPVHPIFYRNISGQMWRNSDKKADHIRMSSRRLF